MARIDQDIIKHKLAILGLHAERNSHAFISRLSTEILETIFIYCARGDLDCPALTAGMPSWINISYVSRHWRNVALNCPILWSYLGVTSERWMEEFLARSNQVPLKLHVNTNHSSKVARASLRLLDRAMKNAERIQELRLTCDVDYGFLHCLSSTIVPHLQTLGISTADSCSAAVYVSPFGEDMPALRTLELSRHSPPLSLFKLSCLTTVSLHHIPAVSQQNMTEFLPSLSSAQNLEHLYLDDALASAAGFLSDAAFCTFQKFSLPRLSRLLITAPLSTVIAFLSCVNIPARTQVRLACHDEQGCSLDNYSRFSSLVAQSCGTSCATTRSLVILPGWGKRVLTFSASERACGPFEPGPSFTNRHWDCDIPLQVILNLHRWSPSGHDYDLTIHTAISGVCCSLPLTNVQSLHVIDPSSASAFWSKILGHLQGLRYLKLTEGWLPDLATVLSAAHDDDTEDQRERDDQQGSERIVAPALVEVVLCRVFFPWIPLPRCGCRPFPGGDVFALHDVLSKRKDSHGGQVTLIECFNSRSYGETLTFDWKWKGQ